MQGQKLLPALGRNASDVLLRRFFEFRANEVLAGFDSENNLDVDLGVSIGHEERMATKGVARQPKKDPSGRVTPNGVWRDYRARFSTHRSPLAGLRSPAL